MAENKETKDTEAKPKKAAAKKPAASKAPAKKPASSAKSTASKTAAGSKAKADSETKTKPSTTKAKSGTSKAKASGSKTTAAAKKTVKDEASARPVVNARARYVRIAPRKARLIADQVRGLPLEDAQTLLRFSPRGAAQDIAKVIASAAANAENNHDLIADDLMVKDIHVDEGPTLRRYRPRALGRASRINKRTCHINVALTPED